ncbi:maleylpyruvate isomerase N-terminal domain-containing protein [Labedaea rhizosphaerae]|uniref:Uncharacterized protein (TIGR03083 family) n=1 Tax=Labedaea rhizosphaerae TaxID=598644 RepID=A0A4R6SFG2_LABRH|nr:maleylpyruvate isomerase N-terminal domain-containing protein [Labedaea rhizosphaerae]TDQ00217.1 uncharacterized protein (TIGR03083 family) [Labedaea rhizosphaerae]
MRVDHATGQAGLIAALDALADALDALTDDRALAPSRCHGWLVCDVLAHLHLGLQEMLLGTLQTTHEAPDTDAATYWRATPPRSDPAADDLDGLVFARRLAAAYRRPTGLVAHLRPTVLGLRTAVGAMADGAVRFQGHVLSTGDFLATWAVEVAVHHLDIDVGDPAAAALRLARQTVDAIAGERMPAELGDAEVALSGFGRIAVPDGLGDRLPLHR